MDKVQRRIGSPVLTSLHVEASGLRLDAASLVPARLPDLFAGSPLTVLGRYRGQGGSVILRGRDEAGREWSQSISGRISDGPAVVPAWARGHLRVLEDRYLVGAADPREIVDVSLRFGVLCRFTAFVAVDKAEVVNAGGKQHQIVQPVEAPAGWDMFAADMKCPPGAMGGSRGGYTAMDFDAAPPLACRVAPPPPSAPAPAAARSRESGFFHSLFGRSTPSSGKDRSASVPAAPTIELTAYRRTARELLDALLASAAGDRILALGILSVKLAALIEDLKSVGAPATELDPLIQLQAELQPLLTAANPADKEVKKMWSRAEKVLRAFAGDASGQPSVAADRRGSFWK
jgi:Ca-activated chloride channel family protein